MKKFAVLVLINTPVLIIPPPFSKSDVNLHEFLIASLDDITLYMGSSLKGENLLLKEQIPP